jgi:hypothetical protein
MGRQLQVNERRQVRKLRHALRRIPFVRAIIGTVRPRPRDKLLRILPKGSVCAEVGVWKGDFSEMILKNVKPRELHLVDPWVFQSRYPDRWYGGQIAAGQAEMDSIYQYVHSRFARNPVVKIHRRFSRELREIFPEKNLDWIYIDGDHSKDAVKLDVRLALDVVKPGGMIVGDDYYWRDSDGSYSVRDAITELARELDLNPSIVDGQFIIVPDRG